MRVFEYTAIVWKESEGYVSKCPELGVASCGDTFDEAVKNLREAVELYLENAKDLGIGASPTWIVNNRHKFSGIDPETIRKNFCQHNPKTPNCDKTLSSKTNVKPGACGKK